MKEPRQIFSNALAHHRAGKFDKAEKLYKEVLSRVPDQVDCLHLLGVLATQRGEYSVAIQFINRAIDQKKSKPVAEFHNNIGAAYKGLGQKKEAIHHFGLAARLKPDYAEAFNNLGTVLTDNDDFDKAEKNFKRALSLNPKYAKAHCGLGNIALTQGRTEEATKHYNQALVIDPNSLESHSNLGRAYVDLGCFDEAETCFRAALSINPNYAPAHYNLGTIFEELGLLDDALSAYKQALTLNPKEPDYHWNTALMQLLKGDYKAGWSEYEWRLRRSRKLVRDTGRVRWDGSNLTGRTILIQTEQGFGDTFQFIRYAQIVKEYDARVIIECQPKTERLIANVVGVDEVITRDQSLPPVDCFIELLSLPYLLETTLDTVPAPPSYICACPNLTRLWAERVNMTPGNKVGLVWRGNSLNTINSKKSIPINDLARLFTLDGISWFSIQLDASKSELDTIRLSAPIEECGPGLTDWEETAALIANLDLVIAVDTGVAHLAGALGKPVWILLSHVPDWRWMTDRSDSPWYPSARLYRQPALGDWTEVMGNVFRDLKEFTQKTNEVSP